MTAVSFGGAALMSVLAMQAHAATCRQQCLTKGEAHLTIRSGAYDRTFIVFIPDKYNSNSPAPLLLDLHGYNLTAEDQRQRSGQLAQSKARGFIVVWPQGLNKSWNGYGCCGASNATLVDDVGFLKAVIGTVSSRANIDADRVFVSGFSTGASMAHRMACEATSLIRAAAPVSFPLNTDACRPSRAISVTAFAGTADQRIAYEGKSPPATVAGIPFGYQGEVESLSAWAKIDQCSQADYSASAVSGATGAILASYAKCKSSVKAELLTIQGGGHSLYRNPAGLDLPNYMWEHVFSR